MIRDDPSPARDATAEAGRSRPGLGGRLWAWFNKRTGADRILRASLDEPIPGGARFAYVFGSALLFIFVSQVVTGLCLALYYVPAPMTAHVSVAYIVKEVAAGSFLRSLHSYGSSAMVVVLLLHFVQTLLYGSYKGKREILWISGCTLSLLVLGMAFTGYLLPWDQKAYFAGSVGTDIVGQVPLVGESLRRLLRGGATMGALTISRFYVLHILIIPALIFALVATHIALFRKAGAAGPVKADPASPPVPAEMFYPRQVLIDMAFVLLVMGVLGMLAHFIPVTLGPEANPTQSQYLPRPEWYFLPMFQWLKYWEGWRTVIGVVIIPAVLIALVFLLPFMDRGPERRPWRRPIPVGGVFIVLGGLLWLGMQSHLDDSRDPAVSAQLAQQSQIEDTYSQAAFQPYSASPRAGAVSAPLDAAAVGSPSATAVTPLAAGVPAAAPTTAMPSATTAATKVGAAAQSVPAPAGHATSAVPMPGEATYQAQGCAACHGVGGIGTSKGPALTTLVATMTAAALTGVLQHPTAKMQAGGMPPVQATGATLTALVAYVESLATTVASPAAPATPAAAPGAPPSKVAPVEPATTATPPAPSTPASKPTEPSSPPAQAAPGQPSATPAATSPPSRRGDTIFTTLGCAACHGAGGIGTSKGPALTKLGPTMTASALITVLQHPTDKMNAGGMPPVSATGTDLSALVAYLESLSTPAAATAPATTRASGASSSTPSPVAAHEVASPPAMNASETKGKLVFDAHGCAACHGTGGVAGTAAAAGLAGPIRTIPALLTTMLRHPTARMQQGGMPPVSLSDPDLEALVAYVSYISLLKHNPQ